MPYEIFRTTAEDIIGATDATLQLPEGAYDNIVAEFLDIPLDNAINALNMAVQLGLIQNAGPNQYQPLNPYAIYLITSNIAQKAALIRFVLEQYHPYRTFKIRLRLTNSINDAANQTRALHSLIAHRGDIIATFISLGTYSNSLQAEGAGRYKLEDNEDNGFLSIIGEIIQNRELAEAQVRRNLEPLAADWIDVHDVLNPLITSYQRAAVANEDSRAPIVYAGNAIESFLVQVASHYGVNITGANGINAKADRIAQQGYLTEKHKFMIKYLGHLRNAADHGVDTNVGQTWEVTMKTSVEYVYVAQSTISALVDCILNNHYKI